VSIVGTDELQGLVRFFGNYVKNNQVLDIEVDDIETNNTGGLVRVLATARVNVVGTIVHRPLVLDKGEDF
jgi:hypothetical protein